MDEVTPAQAAAPADGEVLVDVREDDEWAAGHAPGAVHIRLGALETAELPEGRLLMICRSGNRSGVATEWLTTQGRAAANVVGGMQEWERGGLEVIAGDGSPGTVI